MQTRRYSSSRVREVQTRDMSKSTCASDDVLRPFPLMVDMRCMWEPNDSSCGPGKLYLNERVAGEPPIEPFAENWMSVAQKIEEGLHLYFDSASIFTPEVKAAWEAFMAELPWDGLESIPRHKYRPFHLAPLPQVHGVAYDPTLVALHQSVGEDAVGHLRLNFRDGVDQMAYPRAPSTIAYGKHMLDGTARVAKKRKRGEQKQRCW